MDATNQAKPRAKSRPRPDSPINRQTRAIRRIAAALETLPEDERLAVLAFVNQSEGQQVQLPRAV